MEKDININGMRLHYVDTGPKEAPSVVLMHGWGCNSSTVRFIADILDSGMRVVNVDLPGHGKSEEPTEVWGIEQFTNLIEELIKKLELNKPALIGHSFGGRIAILLSSRNDVGKVLLVDSAGIKPRRKFSYYRKVYTFKVMKKVAHLLFNEEKAKAIIERWRNKKGSADYRNASPMMRAVMSRCVNEDLKHVMSLIKSPVLLVWGNEDTATPLSDAKTMEKLIPDAGLVSFPGCGHYSFLDNPTGFKAVTKEFFKNELKGYKLSPDN